jgi:hypothetical protein
LASRSLPVPGLIAGLQQSKGAAPCRALVSASVKRTARRQLFFLRHQIAGI